MSKSPFTPEQKIKACEDYINGYRSASEIARELSINKRTIREWNCFYRQQGPEAFLVIKGNKKYTKDFKEKIVKEYLDGFGTVNELAAKHRISSCHTIRQWILMYNSDMELKDYDPKREVYMAEARRKTTIEERKEIVEYCINNHRNYKDTAEKHDISYSQIYSWVRKYDLTGEEGLTDKRGCHKKDEEVDELEKLRRENKRLKRQLEESDMTVELLKKVKEFERRRF
jgi:transposase-like protein